MGIEFLGNKKQLESFILGSMEKVIDNSCHTFFDLFSGTGSVSAALKRAGYNVIANDFLSFTSCLTRAILCNNREPDFAGLKEVLKDSYLEYDPYGAVLHYLNQLSGREGFVYKNYSPASIRFSDVTRMYFTEENAKKIDGVRMAIEEWSPMLTTDEKCLLIADLIYATSAVSNVAGTYGCYIKRWKANALKELVLTKSLIIPGKATYTVHCEDANEIVKKYSVDVIYADPPYTKRQYSAYYHILETIACYDDPVISGTTGLRDWKAAASDYCYKRKAPRALQNLLSNMKCKYFVLSYSNEGQISHEDILELMKPYGHVTVFEMPYRRYKSNTLKQKNDGVTERLYILKMVEQNGTGQCSRC